VTLPLRGEVSGFAVQLTVTLPLPVPDVRSTVSQPAPEDAVQAHDEADAVTVTVTDPCPASGAWLVRDSVNVQGGGASFAACDTVTVRPAIVSAPVRAEPVAFASAVNVTVPSPEPDAPAVI